HRSGGRGQGHHCHAHLLEDLRDGGTARWIRDGASGPAVETATLWGRVPARDGSRLCDGESAGEGLGGGAKSPEQTHPRGHILIPGEEGRQIRAQRDQLLHDGGGAAGERVRGCDGTAEGDYRADLAVVADQGEGVDRQRAGYDEVQGGAR